MALKPNQIRFVEHDTLPALRGALTNDDGTPVNLTGASVKLHVQYDTPLVKVANITNPAGGVWEVTWGATDLVAGTWNYEIQVTDAGGGIRTWNRETATDKPLQMVIDGEVA